jgi:hypothetical protein
VLLLLSDHGAADGHDQRDDAVDALCGLFLGGLEGAEKSSPASTMTGVRQPAGGLAARDLPDACAEPFVPVLWLQVLELLGRVPEGSTAKFLQDGTVPD